MRVKARWRISSRRRPSAGSATSSRVVFEPMSMQPQIMNSGYRLACMAGTLWLLRHGDAEPHGARADFDRRLTARGERQSRAAGRALARLGVGFDGVFASPRVRALETARLACAELGLEPVVHAPLSGGFDERDCARLLTGQRAGRDAAAGRARAGPLAGSSPRSRGRASR